MSDTSLQQMMGHVEKNEGRIYIPYKINGQLTTGVGFKATDANAFAGLPFKVKDAKTGELRYASESEKRQEFERIKSMSGTELKKDVNAFRLEDSDIDAKLKSEVETRIGKVKGEIGEGNWDKLTDGQKAAMLDIHYANGSLNKFPELKKAIERGDAEGMADQAGFHSGDSRNWEREARNQAAILGVSDEEGRRIIQDKFKDQNPVFSGPVAPPKQTDLSTLRPEPRPQDQSGQQETQPQQTEQPQPAPAQEQKQSEASSDPKVAEMVAMAGAPVENAGQAALLKPADKLTQSEMMDLVNSAQGDYRGWRAGDPLKAHTYEKVQDWHLAMYGDGPQATDGGKPVEPSPIRPIPQVASPHTTSDGEDLWQATGRLGRQVADAAAVDGTAQAVTGLQRGLNMLNDAHPLPARSNAYAPYTKLPVIAEDGSYGPQTDFALKHATARLGPDKVEEGLALGRFNTFARNVQAGGAVDGLADTTHSIFGPLLRQEGDTTSPKAEAGALQKTLNGFGADLAVDNWIGPKTTDAFADVLKAEDADTLTTSFGKGLGFL